jgi:hypothetical protein
MQELETEYGQVALKFATALLNGDFEEAYSFLGSTLCIDWTPVLLQETYEEMVKYFHIPPGEVSVDVVDTTMPNMKPDSAWVYVSIIGEGNGEAITVIVTNENGRCLIQELEWGRP